MSGGILTEGIDHVELCTDDRDRLVGHLTDGLGFVAGPPRRRDRSRVSVPLAQGAIRLHVTTADEPADPTAGYVARHREGVRDIAFAVPDAVAAFDDAVRAGARRVAEPATRIVDDGPPVLTATVAGPGDLVHSFVERAGPRRAAVGGRLRELDHVALCVPGGTLAATVRFYVDVLGFRVIFSERIEVGRQAMDSAVVRDRGGATLTLLEPDRSREPGQIDMFLDRHGGAGVQHLAFRTDDIADAVGALRDRGVAFLPAPGTYYASLADRVPCLGAELTRLQARDVLVDRDHWGLLLQIFTRSEHPDGTLFFELIERRRARTFGSGNITALYRAVEQAQLTAGSIR